MKKIYTEKVIDHFKNPRNKGKLKDFDAHVEQGSPICGDVMEIYIKVKDNRIEEIGWDTLGCMASVATSSALSELAKGKTLEEAERIIEEDVIKYLGALPQVKVHCSTMGIEGLKKAIQKYREKHKK